MTLKESPLLLAARPAVAELWDQAETPEPAATEEEEPAATVPVEETPLDVSTAADNGVTAKTLVPTDPSGYTVCGRTYISNSTSHELSIADLQEVFAAELTDETPQILILHTHGSEAYTPAGDVDIVWSGDHRTTDYRYNVVAVGDEMAEVFSQAGISVLHDRTLYDYPSYTGAYDRSLAAIQSYLAQYPSIRFILDVHRDAIEDGEGNQYKVVSAIDGVGTAAQMSIVVGSDGSGLDHPNWLENLRLAVAIQEETLDKYPTLMRPVLLRNSRYNQHATTGSLLVEVGAAGNSPEEAALAGRLFAEQMVEALEARSK
jgi:stage II sporulation protein P